MPKEKKPKTPKKRSESGHWNPKSYDSARIARYMRRCRRRCEEDLREFLGPYRGAIVAAEVRRDFAELQSVAMLRREGVALQGDAPTGE